MKGDTGFIEAMVSGSLVLVAAALIALGAFVLRTSPRKPIGRWFAGASLSVALWTLSIAAAHSLGGTDIPIRLAFAAASFIPVTFVGFVQSFSSPTARRCHITPTLLLFAATVFGALSIATPLVVFNASLSSTGLHRNAGPLYPIFVVYFLSVFIHGAALLFFKWRNARGLERAQLQHVGMAMFVSSIGAVTTNLAIPAVTGNSDTSWLGPYFGLLFISSSSHAIIRHRLMDIRLIVDRSLTFILASIMSLAPAALAVGLLWKHLSSDVDNWRLVSLLLIPILASILVPPTRDLAEKVIDRYVRRSRANFQRIAKEASGLLTGVLNLKDLLSCVNRLVDASVAPEGVAIFLRNASGLTVAVQSIREESYGFRVPAALPAATATALIARKHLIIADELLRDRSASISEMGDELRRLNCAVVLPIVSEDVVMGAIFLGPKLSGDPFYTQDLDLLMTLANQAGTAIKNAQLYMQVVLANEYIENIVSTIESGVIAIDATGNVAMFNRAAEELTGLRASAMREEPAAVLPKPLRELLLGTLAEGQGRSQPEIELAADGVTRPVLCTTSPLRDPAGTVLGAVAVFSDLTPLKELEDQRRRAERLAYFEVLASSLAHEIKNPLVSIKTFAQLIPRRRDDDRFVDEFSRIVSREIERMERLLTRLRTLSRPGERPRQPIDLRAPIREAIEFMRPAFDEKRVVLRVNLGSEPSTILGDQGQLEELFLNLLMNAREVTPPEGVVTVDLLAVDGAARVFVADTGPGLASEVIDKIFDPFFTTKQGGSGLGLAICSGIATSHRANLRAANGPAGGAVFTFELPVASPVTAAARR